MIKKGALTVAKALSQFASPSVRAFHTINKYGSNCAKPRVMQIYYRSQFNFGKGSMR